MPVDGGFVDLDILLKRIRRVVEDLLPRRCEGLQSRSVTGIADVRVGRGCLRSDRQV